MRVDDTARAERYRGKAELMTIAGVAGCFSNLAYRASARGEHKSYPLKAGAARRRLATRVTSRSPGRDCCTQISNGERSRRSFQ